MTTENKEQEKIEPRSINELVKMNTYQDMTDEEIDILTDFKLQIAIRDEAFTQRMEAQKEAEAELLNEYKITEEHARENLEKLIAEPLKLIEVSDG